MGKFRYRILLSERLGDGDGGAYGDGDADGRSVEWGHPLAGPERSEGTRLLQQQTPAGLVDEGAPPGKSGGMMALQALLLLLWAQAGGAPANPASAHLDRGQKLFQAG